MEQKRIHRGTIAIGLSLSIYFCSILNSKSRYNEVKGLDWTGLRLATIATYFKMDARRKLMTSVVTVSEFELVNSGIPHQDFCCTTAVHTSLAANMAYIPIR
jgi:hypothetical protein